MSSLDVKGEVQGLVDELHLLSADLATLSKLHNSIECGGVSLCFVKGRQIPDDILIANELVVDARMLKKELILFKVDFEKAYD
ncbi:hypothetical protein MTR_1g047690 [Medicago truncatula]|uniref:Uncharacterized protein n=1 Tax=Medicago truncatula TaxID=3880 RepID=A0A072VI41_MEDTR|nr:hypothetical protein MTR_1g047690 [Medicago truncatula]